MEIMSINLRTHKDKRCKHRTFEDKIKLFWERVEKTETCWIWTGSMNGNGYGKIHINKKKVYAHRLSHELFIGKILEGLQVDHLCFVKNCVNPDHLEAVTPYVNNMRSKSQAALNLRKTHCLNGHLLEGYNLMPNKKNTRQCRSCHNDRRRKNNDT
jgi:hypothetical protein